SITGGEVYRGDLIPEEWDGVYFGGDFTRDELFALQLDATGTEVIRRIEFKPTEFLPGSSPNIVYLGVGQDDALYYINFDVAGGQVSRIFHGTPNEAPTITNANVSGAAGASQFTYSATFGDAEGDSIDWVINFGDGTSQSGTAQSGDTINVTKNFQSSGFFEASIEASDGTSTAFSNSLAATSGNPNNQPVVEAFTVDNPFPDPAEPIAFTIDGSDADGDPLTFELAFGDGATQQGSLPANGDPVVVNRTYDSDGSFLAQVTIFDDQGGQTLSAPIEINVGETTGPGVTDGLVLELESDIKIGLNGDIVVNWLDGSGAGNNLDGFGDPRLVPNATPGGRPAIVFDGDGDFLVREDTANSPISGLADGDGARSLFFVVDYGETNNVSSGVVYGNGAPNEAFGLTNSFAPTAEANFMVQGWGRGNDEISGVNGADAGWVVQSVVVEDNGDWTHYVDGVAIDSGNRSWNTNIERLIIGGEINDLGESELSVAAIFGYNRALSEGERQQVEGYLQDKYLQASSAGSPPTAANDGYTGPQDATLTIPVGTGLLANDTDPDTATLTVTQINGVNVTNGQTVALANGSLTINADGSFTFVPNGGFVGDQTFAYTVSDGALTDTATATLTFEQTSGGGDNTAPTATVDAYTQTTGGTLSVGAAQGLLANDNDVDNDTLTVTAINGQAVANGQTVNLDNGALTIRADGSFDYTPTGGFVGAEAFTYSIADGNGGTDTTAALIEVTTAAGSPPNASFDSYATVVGQALTTTAGNGLLANDSDPDNNPIVVTRIDNQAVTNGQTVQLDNGSLTINVNGSFTYTPNGGFQGAEAFSYTISDNLHGDDTSVALIDVVAQQAGGSPPVAANDAYQTMEDSLLSVSPALGLLANDFDADNDALTVTQINGQNITDGQQIDLGDGMLTIDTDGSFSFMPDAGFNGAETFAYTVSDGVDGISVGAVTIDVLDGGPPAGEVPVQNGLVAWLESDARVTLGVGDQVNGWLDKSGIGIDLAVLGSPTLVQDATPTGIDAIRLDGVDDALVRIGAQNLSPLPGGNQDRTVFIVADYIDQNGVFAGVAYGEGLPNEAFGVVSTGSELLAVQGWGGGNDIISGVSDGDNVGADEWLVQSAILDDGQITHFLNDAIIDTGSQTYATDITSATSQLIIGGEIAGRGFAEMEVAAVLIYDRALSASEHDAVEQYLLEKFVTGSANAMGAEIELGNDVGGFDALSAVSNFGFNAESFVENEDLSGRTELIESMDENERLFRGVMSPEEAFIF
ncbi:MAG: Ig-like domain-containing protein, partial [Pseudomonadota bacterium]